MAEALLSREHAPSPAPEGSFFSRRTIFSWSPEAQDTREMFSTRDCDFSKKEREQARRDKMNPYAVILSSRTVLLVLTLLGRNRIPKYYNFL